MAKYIDLLREHQRKDGKRDSLPTADEVAATDMDNTGEHKELESMLAEDTVEGSADQFSATNGLPADQLLAEEESTENDFSTTSMPPESPTRKTGSKAEKSTGASDGAGVSDAEVADWLSECTLATAELFNAAKENRPMTLHPLTEELNRFLNMLSADIKLINTLELEVSERERKVSELDPDLGSLIQKAIMMMLYAIKTGLQLDFDTDELRSHVLAAMVHHIGMAQISSEIRNKKEKLTKDEIKDIRTASKKSHDYLTLCGITDAAILQAAGQAQERYDGSGPQGLSGSSIAYSARMIGLLSMFEALIHYRPYRNRLLPRDAIRELVNHHKKAFDPDLLKALIESISLYPVGTYVQLNSGDIGLVIRVHHRLPLRPVVRIMFDSGGGDLPIREIDLKGQPNLMVQRCMYEEGIKELEHIDEQGA